MLYTSLTMRDFLATTCTTSQVKEFLRDGLGSNNEPMTVLSIQELAKRGNEGIILEALNGAFEQGQIPLGSQFAVTLINTLSIVSNGSAMPLLRRYAKAAQCSLEKGKCILSLPEWIRAGGEKND